MRAASFANAVDGFGHAIPIGPFLNETTQQPRSHGVWWPNYMSVVELAPSREKIGGNGVGALTGGTRSDRAGAYYSVTVLNLSLIEIYLSWL